jgi:hypothetical protein
VARDAKLAVVVGTETSTVTAGDRLGDANTYASVKSSPFARVSAAPRN